MCHMVAGMQAHQPVYRLGIAFREAVPQSVRKALRTLQIERLLSRHPRNSAGEPVILRFFTNPVFLRRKRIKFAPKIPSGRAKTAPLTDRRGGASEKLYQEDGTMSLRINIQLSSRSTRAVHNVQNASDGFSRSIEAPASGLRINRAGDDPAGLIRSEDLRARLRVWSRQISNSQDATNLVKTAEGALEEVHNLLRLSPAGCGFGEHRHQRPDRASGGPEPDSLRHQQHQPHRGADPVRHQEAAGWQRGGFVGSNRPNAHRRRLLRRHRVWADWRRNSGGLYRRHRYA